MRGVIVGSGYFARFQYEAWTRIPEVEISACCDLVEEKSRALMAQFGIPRYYSDWREMIRSEQPDFIDIITPPPTHQAICGYAAGRNVNIICQKPLAPTLEESERIVHNTRGVSFMVHENFRWQPWYRKIKEIQQAGTIGAFTHVHMLTRLGDGWGDNAYLERQPFFREYPRLLLYETGIHFVDTFRFLLGEVTAVRAQIRRLNPVIQGEDAGQLFLQFESGATALWDANRYNEVESASPRYTFGELRIDAAGGHINMDTAGNIRMKPLGQPGVDVEYEHRDLNFAGDCVYRLQRHFVDCMLSGREFESTGEDYLKTTAVVFAAYSSAREWLVPAAPV